MLMVFVGQGGLLNELSETHGIVASILQRATTIGPQLFIKGIPQILPGHYQDAFRFGKGVTFVLGLGTRCIVLLWTMRFGTCLKHQIVLFEFR